MVKIQRKPPGPLDISLHTLTNTESRKDLSKLARYGYPYYGPPFVKVGALGSFGTISAFRQIGYEAVVLEVESGSYIG